MPKKIVLGLLFAVGGVAWLFIYLSMKQMDPPPRSHRQATARPAASSPAPAKMKPQPAPLPAVPALSERVVLDVNVVGREERKVSVEGITNLPDDTELMVTISNSLGYRGQESASVLGRRFRAGPFSAHGQPLPEGRYTVDVTMPIPRVQPAAVRSVIGEHGEKLSGKLVHRGRLLTVERQDEFFLGDSLANAAEAEKAQLQRIKSEGDAVLGSLRALLRAGRRMEPLRQTHDLDKLRRCGELMRERQAEAIALGERAGNIPGSFGGSLMAVAATQLKLCVSCSRTLARQNCQGAEESLAQARAAWASVGR